jgi:hypothetical protein
MARTGTLPTMDTPKHQELCDQARVYAGLRDRWLSLSRQFKTEKDTLLMLMRQAGLKIYDDNEEDLHIEIQEKETITVKYGQDTEE